MSTSPRKAKIPADPQAAAPLKVMDTPQAWADDLRAATQEYDAAREKSIDPSAPPRLVGLLQEFRAQTPKMRTDIINQVGRDDLALRVLGIIVQHEPESRLRIRIVDLFCDFRPPAFGALMNLADDPTEDVCLRAIDALGKVVLAMHPELAKKTGVGRHANLPLASGVSTALPVSEDAERVLTLLNKLGCQEWSDEIRRAAEQTLARLDA